MMVLGQEPRQATSNLGHLNKPSIQVSFIPYSLLDLHTDDIFQINTTIR